MAAHLGAGGRAPPAADPRLALSPPFYDPGTHDDPLPRLLDAFVAIAAERDVDVALDRAVDLARVTTGAPYGFALARPGARPVTVIQGLHAAQVARLPCAGGAVPPDDLVAHVLATGAPRRIGLDAGVDAPRPHPGSDVVPLGGLLASPVVHGDEVLGALVVGHPPGGDFSERDEAVLRAIARQVAVAVHASPPPPAVAGRPAPAR